MTAAETEWALALFRKSVLKQAKLRHILELLDDPTGKRNLDIGADNGLPSDFGFPMVLDPDDPDSAFVIPLVADMDRVTPEGRVRVYETRDAGASWTARAEGLPDSAYLTILRQAFGHDGQPGFYEFLFHVRTPEDRT